MSRCNYKKKNNAAGILFLTVFALLQLSLWGPPFLRAPHEEGCQQDHALCGCSPGRIASATCCCALAAISPCCQQNYIEAAREEKAAAGRVIASLPCGGSEDPLVTAGSEDYLIPNMKMSVGPLSTTVYPPVAAMSRLDFPLRPPIPPPKA